MIQDSIKTLGIIENNCETVFDIIGEEVENGHLSELIDAFKTTSNVYVSQALSFCLGDYNRTSGEMLKVFEFIEALIAQDQNTYNNLITALARFEQKGIDWRTPEREQLVERFLAKCQRFGELLRDYAEDHAQRLLPDR